MQTAYPKSHSRARELFKGVRRSLIVSRFMSSSTRIAREVLDSHWSINVAGRVYGPYTGKEISAFVKEGRVAPHSIVRAGEEGPWITAIDDPILGQLFVADEPRKVQAQAATAGAGASAVATSTTEAQGVAESNFVIITDLRGTGTGQLQSAIAKMGQSYRLTSSSWVLRCARTAGSIRNELTVHLGRQDSVFVVDTSHNKTAWFNLGPDADVHIRKVWARDNDASH